MTAQKIKQLIDEYVNGMLNCNIPKSNIIKAQSLLNDFYNNKIKGQED